MSLKQLNIEYEIYKGENRTYNVYRSFPAFFHLCRKKVDEIRVIDIEALKLYSQQGGCVDDYLFLTDRLENILSGDKTVKMKVFLMIYCVQGEVRLDINNETYSLKPDDLLVSLPNMVVGGIMASPDYQVRIICFSGRFVQRLTQTEKYTWKSFHYLHWHPVKHFNEAEKTLFNQYLDLITYEISQESTSYQKEILLYLSSAFFTKLLAATNRKLSEYGEGTHRFINQPDFIFKRFMEALAADNGRHRTLEYYASKFCYSPKYLSHIIKRVSGKNALTLIHENAIEHIILALRLSSKSIKEIAADFEFSNVSFFSQYVKKHLGVTPSEYRNSFISVVQK